MGVVGEEEIVLDRGPSLTEIENVVVMGSKWRTTDFPWVFGDSQPIHFTKARDLPNLLVELQIFPSTSKARQAGREGPIPPGFTGDFKASKKRRLWIWNPTEP